MRRLKILFLGILLLPLLRGELLLAQSKGVVTVDAGILTVNGSCAENVVITLYQKSSKSKQSVYSAGSECVNKKYEYKDDLQEWNLPETEYYVSVTGKDSKKEHLRNLVAYKRPEVKGLTTPGSTEPDKVENDSYWRALDDIGGYIVAIQDRLGFANTDLEASDQPEPVKLSAQGLFVLMQEGTQNLLGLLDSVRIVLTESTANLISPVPTGNEPELISPLVTPVPSITPIPSPTLAPTTVPESTGSAVLSL